MQIFIKKRLLQFLNILLVLSIFSCKNNEIPYTKLKGETMGTYYTMQYDLGVEKVSQSDLDSILVEFNQSLSTYISNSTISTFNTSKDTFCYMETVDKYFKVVFDRSKEIYLITNGAFNPAIMPLVNYYGFGYEKSKKVEEVDTTFIREIMPALDFDSITMRFDTIQNSWCIEKKLSKAKIDFSAIAKGYGVDVIAKYLENQGAKNYMVDIGGEVRTLGQNQQNKDWVIGINRPSDKANLDEVELMLSISGKSIATSGNYRNYYESKGQKFAHIIDPKTGFNRPTDILSTSVITDDCMTADGLATAFMVMGLDKALEIAEQLKEVEACFIYDLEGDGVFEFKMTKGFSNYFLNKEQSK